MGAVICYIIVLIVVVFFVVLDCRQRILDVKNASTVASAYSKKSAKSYQRIHIPLVIFRKILVTLPILAVIILVFCATNLYYSEGNIIKRAENEVAKYENHELIGFEDYKTALDKVMQANNYIANNRGKENNRWNGYFYRSLRGTDEIALPEEFSRVFLAIRTDEEAAKMRQSMVSNFEEYIDRYFSTTS